MPHARLKSHAPRVVPKWAAGLITLLVQHAPPVVSVATTLPKKSTNGLPEFPGLTLFVETSILLLKMQWCIFKVSINTELQYPP
jgi:hypothetical protein